MKIYSVSLARARLADLLDAAERGERVFIERRGIRHAIMVAEPAMKWTGSRPRLEIVDEDVESGSWTWDWKAEGVEFKAPRRRKR